MASIENVLFLETLILHFPVLPINGPVQFSVPPWHKALHVVTVVDKHLVAPEDHPRRSDALDKAAA